ncbi:MAG: hypothetical protein U0002_15635 [Thermoanaerobaculia bacterium]
MAELRAVSRELRATAAYLVDVYAERIASSLPPEELRLATRAGRWSRQVLRLAAEIEAQLPALHLEN